MKNTLNVAEWRLQRRSTNALSSAHGQRPERAVLSAELTNAIVSIDVPTEWQDAGYRQAAMEGTLENLIAWQVRVNREERGMTQADLAVLMGTQQSAISKLEDPEGGDVLVSTLIKAAHAFNCALLVRFVEFTEFAATTIDVRPERLFAAEFGSTPNRLRAPRKRSRGIKHGPSQK